MKCPNCLVRINPSFSEFQIGNDKEGSWSVYSMICPNEECAKIIVELAVGQPINANVRNFSLAKIYRRQTVKPFTSNRPPVPAEVELGFATDYTEACLILSPSPKASAALSRRCLQSILREKAGVTKGNLANEIQQVIDNKSLPSHLSESIDAIRNIGNFAAHPVKSTSSGEVVDVENGEAEWLLDVLEALFDFYFVQPAILKSKRDALNKKLVDAGKPPMK